MGRYPHPPADWQFSPEAREAHKDRFWSLPVRLVEDGLWAELWRADATVRGGGTSSSVLPVLAMHAWPGKTSRYGADSAGLWTPWDYLSVRRIARLAGVHTDTVVRVFQQLERLELVQRQLGPAEPHQGGPPRRLYRLAGQLYPGGKEPYTKVSAALLYHGLWAMLPTTSARHLYLALAALDPVLDEDGFRTKMADNPILGDGQDPVFQARCRAPRSIAQLATLTGMTRSTVEEALKVLRAPLFWADTATQKQGLPADVALVQSGPGATGQAFWHVPDRRALRWWWEPQCFTTPAAIRKYQLDHWPHLLARRVDPVKRQRRTAARSQLRHRQNAAKKGAAKRPNPLVGW